MHISRLIWPALLAAAFVAAPATAKPPAYQSAFTGYLAWIESTPLSWKESNERIARAPGHAGHDPHQGHDMGEDPHMGHDMGHDMGKDKADDPHKGHDMGKDKADDPHKGHDMGHDQAQDQPPAQPAPTKPDPHQGHQHEN